jgi:rod shape-determining protein MreD
VRALVALVVVAITVVVQLTIVDRIAFPGGAGPDLVLLTVAALAVAGGPMVGVLTGFLAGLALDVAPPGSHFTGQNALVFCLVGYACGLLADESGDAEQGHTALFEIMVTAAGAVCGEALLALLGVMLSDPRVTWPAITHVLPAAVVWDVLLCPFVLYAVAAALRPVSRRSEKRPAGWSPSQARPPVPGASQGAIRQLAGGNSPRLRLGERDRNAGSLGLRGSAAARPAARREPQLKLGRSGSAPRLGGAAFAPVALAAGGSRVRFGKRREGMLGGSRGLRGGSGGLRVGSGGLRVGSGSVRTASGSLRAAPGGLGGGSRFGRSSLGRSLLGGSVFSRSSASLGTGPALSGPTRFGRPGVFGRSAPLGRSSPFRHRGNLIGSAGSGLAGRAPRFSRGSPLAWLTGALRRPAGGSGLTGGRSPGRGWLRRSSSPGAALGPGSSLAPGSSLTRGSSLGRRRFLGRGAFGTRSTFGARGGFGTRGTFGTRGVFGRRRAARNLTTRNLTNRSLTTRSLTTRSLTGTSRLRMPRPKAKRGWRTGGYR